MELTFLKVFSLTREHVLKMNVFLIKECLHVSQTENAFSEDLEWACEPNTIQQNIHVPGTKMLACRGVSVGPLDKQ